MKRLTIAEAAKRAGVNPMTVRRWIRSQKLQAAKQDVGGVQTWVIDPEHLEAFLSEQGARQGPPESPEVLAERVAGLEAMVELLRSQIDAKDSEIRALIATNARLTEIEAELLTKALPAGRGRGFWGRLLGR